jgi:hypothetical protein
MGVGLGWHRHPLFGATIACSVTIASQSSYWIRPLGARPPLGRCHHRRVRCPRRKCSFAPTALFVLEAINRGGVRAFSWLSTLGTECPCLGSA